VPGGIFPNYELPDHTGTLRKLSELQGDDPLILTLSRGHYCPKEHQQHLELAAFYPKIAVAYTQIATIATDDHHTLQEFRASIGAEWTFLSDPDRTIQKDLDIQEYTDPEHNPMIPHSLRRALSVDSPVSPHFIKVLDIFSGRKSASRLRKAATRAEARTILNDLRALKCRALQCRLSTALPDSERFSAIS